MCVLEFWRILPSLAELYAPNRLQYVIIYKTITLIFTAVKILYWQYSAFSLM